MQYSRRLIIGNVYIFQEPLYLDKCIVCCEADQEDYFEIQEVSSKDTFIFKVTDVRWIPMKRGYWYFDVTNGKED